MKTITKEQEMTQSFISICMGYAEMFKKLDEVAQKKDELNLNYDPAFDNFDEFCERAYDSYCLCWEYHDKLSGLEEASEEEMKYMPEALEFHQNLYAENQQKAKYYIEYFNYHVTLDDEMKTSHK